MFRMVLAAALLCSAAGLNAQEDVFAFIPLGGRGLIEELAPTDAKLSDALATAQSADGWDAALASDLLPGTAGLEDVQRRTLAEYLAYAGPRTTVADLPWDGRDMALAKCQSCHIITVVVTQDRTREAWLGTMHKPSHIEIALTEEERGQLADYLVLNAGIPIEDIPVALRAGGASY
jgi:mono/diheme cytochrome c family protein